MLKRLKNFSKSATHGHTARHSAVQVNVLQVFFTPISSYLVLQLLDSISVLRYYIMCRFDGRIHPFHQCSDVAWTRHTRFHTSELQFLVVHFVVPAPVADILVSVGCHGLVRSHPAHFSTSHFAGSVSVLAHRFWCTFWYALQPRSAQIHICVPPDCLCCPFCFRSVHLQMSYKFRVVNFQSGIQSVEIR